MQFVHILISCATAAIILKSRLSLVEKILVIFGYYFFFEYNLISRNYGLSAMLMILLVYYNNRESATLVRLSVIMFFLAQAHLFALVFSVAFVITYLVFNRNSIILKDKAKIITAGSIILAGWLISAFFIIPPWNYGMKFISYDATVYLSTDRIIKTISVALKGIFYIPDYNAPGHQFINTLYYLTLNLKTWLIYLLSFAAIAIPALVLKRNKFAIVLFLFFTVLFMAIYFFLPLVYGIRYFGFFYIVFLCCWMIARPQAGFSAKIITIVIFALQFVNGVYAYTMDIRYPFSEGKAVSNYIEKERKSYEKVYILNPSLRPAISAYTGEKFFGTENGDKLSYCHWDERLPDSVLKLKLNSLLNEDSSSLIISNNPVYELLDTNRLERLESFSNGIFKGENAVVYRYRK
jgi:hypothetical protein